MLPPGHVGFSYLLTLALARFARRKQSKVGPDLERIAIFGIVMGLVSDLDVIPTLLHSGWDALGDRAGEHRASVLHTLIFAAAVAALTPTFVLREKSLWAAVAFVSVVGHLFLDSLTIGPGVMWLYPFSDELFGINVATRWYRAVWGDDWLRLYLLHPLFWIETALLGAAVAVSIRRRLTGSATAECAGEPD